MHNLGWQRGEEGKGFIVRPSQNGLRHFPELAKQPPIVWTWPTEGMRPTHAQTKVRTVGQVPQGMSPDPTSYFHIQPDGGVYQFGSGRVLDDEDYGALEGADPSLRPVGAQPKVQSDGYGHANRLLEILGAADCGLWMELPDVWWEVN